MSSGYHRRLKWIRHKLKTRVQRLSFMRDIAGHKDTNLQKYPLQLLYHHRKLKPLGKHKGLRSTLLPTLLWTEDNLAYYEQLTLVPGRDRSMNGRRQLPNQSFRTTDINKRFKCLFAWVYACTKLLNTHVLSVWRRVICFVSITTWSIKERVLARHIINSWISASLAVELKKMNTSVGKTILFIIVVITIAMVKGNVHKRCESTSNCGVGECCTSSNRCKRFISEGSKCSVFRQIMGDQCPCVVGSTCTSITNELMLKTRMTCKAIVKQDDREFVEESVENVTIM